MGTRLYVGNLKFSVTGDPELSAASGQPPPDPVKVRVWLPDSASLKQKDRILGAIDAFMQAHGFELDAMPRMQVAAALGVE
ncbi:MAG: hypothetical protein JNK78_13205 [Planctomycetes bacterium]|nr:hypothetical protein [Planctomycetota bacterium]